MRQSKQKPVSISGGPSTSPLQYKSKGLIYPHVLATNRASNRKQQPKADCDLSMNESKKAKKSARSSRSRSKNAMNRLLMEQISKGHQMGRNHMVQTNTMGNKQYKIHYGPDFHESLCENIDSDDGNDHTNQMNNTQKEIPAAGIEVLQDIQCFESTLNKRKGNRMYSFTKNIDYSQLTEAQINRFLQERKEGEAGVSMMADDISSIQKSGLRNREKENYHQMPQQGYQTEMEPKTVQVLQTSKSYQANQLNSRQSNQKMKLVKQTRGIREVSQKKYNPVLKDGRPPLKASKTPRGESRGRSKHNFHPKSSNKVEQKVQQPLKSARAVVNEEKDADMMMKKLTYQYSVTTARIENFKMTGLKQPQSRNSNNLPSQTAKSLQTMTYNSRNHPDDRRKSNASHSRKSCSNNRSENSAVPTVPTPKSKKTPLQHSTPASRISKRNAAQTYESKPWEKLATTTVQINLVNDEDDEKVEMTVLNSTGGNSDVKKAAGPFGVSSIVSNRSNKSSCNEDQMTQRGSIPERHSTNFSNALNERKSIEHKSDIKDDQQYEKHKIWRQSQIENEVLATPQQQSVFDNASLNLMTFIEQCTDPKLEKFDPIKSQRRAYVRDGDDDVMDKPRDTFDSLRKPKTLSQNCQMGPVRPSKIKKMSNEENAEKIAETKCPELEESRATAKFTNQSLTYIEGENIDEFSKDTEQELENQDYDANGQLKTFKMNSEGRKKFEEAAGRILVTIGDMNKGGESQQKRAWEEVQSPVFGENTLDLQQSLRQDDLIESSHREDLNSSWEKAFSDIEARKRQLREQRANSGQQEGEQKTDESQVSSKNDDLDQFMAPIQIEHIGKSIQQTRPGILESVCIKINFTAINEQIEIIKQIRDLLEVRPSQQTHELNPTDSSNDIRQAIDDLTIDDRQRIKQLCQGWWDSSNEDNSFFRMAMHYQQVMEQEQLNTTVSRDGNSAQQDEEENSYEMQQERMICMRKCTVLQSTVIGLTAFYSMLTRKAGLTHYNQDVELNIRQMLHILLKITYDQSMLCLSFALGKLTTYQQAAQNTTSMENKLYKMYNEYIHLLFINKKIQSEDDYQIFNSKGLSPSLGEEEYITNQENRDCQINKLSKRLIENLNKIIDYEHQIQAKLNKAGNVNLLKILRNVAQYSSGMDFQESKNIIYEGISGSDVMPQMPPPDQIETNVDCDKSGLSEDLKEGQPSYGKDAQGRLMTNPQCKSHVSLNYGMHLIKTFKDDVNQIIHEESREESMSVSMMNSSKMREDYTSNSIETRSKYNSQSRASVQRVDQTFKSNTQKHTPEKQEYEKVFEIQNNTSFSMKRKKFEDSIENSIQDLSWSRDIATKSVEPENLQNPNPKMLRVSCLSQFSGLNSKPQEPFLPPMKEGYKYTLVLDLDETLVHCAPLSRGDSQQESTTGEEDMIVYSRPGLHEFLQEMSKYFEIVIFTAGGRAYAEKIVSNCLESQPGKEKLIDHLLFWDHVTIISEQQACTMQERLSKFYSGLDESVASCTSTAKKKKLQSIVNQTTISGDDSQVFEQLALPGGHDFSKAKDSEFDIVDELCDSIQDQCYVKDLSKLGRDLGRTIIVDNLPVNFAWQLRNGICIREYRVTSASEANKSDHALPQLANMLKEIYFEANKDSFPDVREILQEKLIQYRKQKDNFYFV